MKCMHRADVYKVCSSLGSAEEKKNFISCDSSATHRGAYVNERDSCEVRGADLLASPSLFPVLQQFLENVNAKKKRCKKIIIKNMAAGLWAACLNTHLISTEQVHHNLTENQKGNTLEGCGITMKHLKDFNDNLVSI